MSIDDDYLAYCFDEVCYYYVNYAMDDKGKINWNKIKWDKEITEVNRSNKDLMNFIQKHG